MKPQHRINMLGNMQIVTSVAPPARNVRRMRKRKCLHASYHFEVGPGFCRYAVCSGCGWRQLSAVLPKEKR